MEQPIVSFHSAVLYQRDVDILRSPRSWLNDALITFWFEHLVNEVHRDCDKVALVHCAAVMLARFEDDEDDRLAAMRPLRLHEKELVIIPINDSDDVTAVASGSHWATLVWDRTRRQALLFDSGQMDRRIVKEVWQRFWPLVQGEGGSSSAKLPAPPITDGACPKQTDAHSCGVYVCAVADRLAAGYRAALQGAGPLPPADDPTKLTPADIAAYRKHMCDVALSLAHNKGK